LKKSISHSVREIFCMPAKSKKQQMAAGAALAAKRGKRSKSSLRGASRGMYKSMSKKQLREFAKTKRKKLPTKKRKRR
jgi:hypothetical protein